MVAMINHQACHTTIDADVLACDETGLAGAEIEHHIGYIQWIANTTYWLLGGIGTIIHGAGGINPSRRD